MYIRHDSDLYRVVTTSHVTPGKGRGMVQAKIRHINRLTTLSLRGHEKLLLAVNAAQPNFIRKNIHGGEYRRVQLTFFGRRVYGQE